MPHCRVVKPERVRLPLSDGDFIDVKRRLNAGEYRDLIAGMTAPAALGQTAQLDVAKVGMTKVLQYLVGWSLIGLDGEPLPYDPNPDIMPEADRIATLRSLDPETFHEIIQAIDAHEAREDRERSARKNDRTGDSASSVTLMSAV